MEVSAKFVASLCVFTFLFASANSQTCFVNGECRESHHLGGEERPDEVGCLQSCQQETDCNWFTFFPHLSYCEYFYNCSTIDSQFCSDCITGEVSCSVPEPQCFVPGECQGNVDHLEETASQEACLDLCKSREGCRWFTFHRPTSACILYHNCDTISTECTDCVSGESRCESGSSTTTTPQTTTTAQRSVYLVGGSSDNEGNVFAINRISGIEGPVCDDSWDINDANVVCRQLGFINGALEALTGSYFGQTSDEFSYDDLYCTGNEDFLDDCPHENDENCNGLEAAGVICDTGSSTTTTARTTTTSSSSPAVVLVGGSSDHEGNVFATNPTTGFYGPVCDDGWAFEEADVVCKQLGFEGAARATIESQFGSVPYIFSYDNVDCYGTEDALDDCTHINEDEENCGEDEGAGVICIASSSTTTTTESSSPAVALVGGSSNNEGNVFATNPTTGYYGPVCDDGWAFEEADVVCKLLGFKGAADYTIESQFGNVPDKFSYDNVDCYGNEDAFDDCTHQNEDEENCNGDEAAGVICIASSTTTTTTESSSPAVALVGGSSDNEGNVFATNPTTGFYGPVCDDGWAIEEANVVCRQLGFSGADSFTINSHFGNVPTDFAYDNVACTGNEDALDDCTHSDSENCDLTEGAGVVCTTSSVAVALVGGSSSNEGNVFATNPTTGFYGPVCDDGWAIEEANVVCRQLGFSGAVSATTKSYFGNVPTDFAYDNVACVGYEDALDKCTHLDSENCDLTEGAGVICEV